LLLGVVLLSLLGLAAADIATYASLHSFLLQQVDQRLEAGHASVEGGPPGNHPDRKRGDHGPPPTGVDWYGYRTLGSQAVRGRCLVRPCSAPQLPATVHLAPHPNGHGERVTYFSARSSGDEAAYRVRASIEPQNPGRILFVATSLSGLDSTLHRLLLIELIATAGVLAALATLGLWVVRLGLRPLHQIELTADAITAGDLSRRVDHPDPQTEVGRVGSALNTMLDHIEESDRRLRSFIADASHELRTPLAAVRAYAELFERGASSRPEDLARSMSGITRETERMSLLVDDLLLLARLDEGRPLERKPFDLASVVRDAVDAARVVEPERLIELSAEPATVAGDEGRLRQVLDNLLTNVRAHTPEGTPVAVELRNAAGRAELTVADRGPGLTGQQAERVFERFYRADSSRTRASGGVGLGLSIVAAVVEAHRGTVKARPTPGGGASFEITLPLNPD
jgi:two-component system OmpR family sensor kinase